MMREKFLKEIAAMPLPADEALGEPVAEADLAGLPPAAQRYLRFMGVLGRPRDWSFRAHLDGRFRLGPDQRWLSCEAWQYNSRPATARIFYMKLRFGGVLPALGRDTYLAGQGRMRVRLLDLVTVEDDVGLELDIGELVTYLNDAVMLAPSFLLRPQVAWTAVDDGAFDLALIDRGLTVRARVFVDEQGAPRSFSTTDRFCADPYTPDHPLVRTRWTTPIEGWQEAGGRRFPARGQAVWHLPQGEFAYADFQFSPDSIAFNVPPGQ